MKKKKNILITGTSSGIGYLTALTLAREGHTVFASMRDTNGRNATKKEALESIAQKDQLSLEVVELDLLSDTSVQAAVGYITKKVGALDVLVNNAGVMYVGITEAYSLEQVQEQFNTNFFAPMRLSNAVIPHMRAQKEGQIINVSSLAGRLSFPYFGIYCASKWALEAYTESLKYEIAPFGIDVQIVEPGPFPTNLLYSGPKEKEDEVLTAYGDMASIPQSILANFDSMFKSDDAPVTQDVADAISNVVNTEIQKRPFRTVVGLDFGTKDLNAGTAPIQKSLIADVLQMEHLLTVQTAN